MLNASSNINTEGSFKKILAKHNFCFYPADNTEISLSIPEGNKPSYSHKFTFTKTSTISSYVMESYFFAINKLSRILPEKTYVSYPI
jgi:hypothetical protein